MDGVGVRSRFSVRMKSFLPRGLLVQEERLITTKKASAANFPQTFPFPNLGLNPSLLPITQ